MDFDLQNSQINPLSPLDAIISLTDPFPLPPITPKNVTHMKHSVASPGLIDLLPKFLQ